MEIRAVLRRTDDPNTILIVLGLFGGVVAALDIHGIIHRVAAIGADNDQAGQR